MRFPPTACRSLPFGRIEVDPFLCIGCQKCISKEPDGAFLDGCPWDAIEMIPTDDWEGMHGIALPDAPPPPPAIAVGTPALSGDGQQV